MLLTRGSILVSFWRPGPPLGPSWVTCGKTFEKGKIVCRREQKYLWDALLGTSDQFVWSKCRLRKVIKKSHAGILLRGGSLEARH